MRLPAATYVFALLVALAAAGCTADNPLFCISSDQCGNGLECDPIRKECVEPQDVPPECEASSDCTEASAPICDPIVEVCRACIGDGDGDGSGDAECRALGTGADRCVEGACVECAGPGDCAADVPVCSAEGVCGACEISDAGDAACAARDDGALPLCGAAGQCVECREDGDCDSTLCDAVAGRCIAPEAIVFAAPGGTDGADCGALGGTPCQTLGGPSGAVAKLNPGEGRIYVRLAPGTYRENVEIRDLTAIILGEGADLRSNADAESVLVVIDSEVELRGLTIRDTSLSLNAHGIACTANTPRALRVVGTTIADNRGRGIEANGCDLSVVDSVIRNNDSGGLRLMNGELELVSSVVVDNDDAGVVTLDVSSVYIVNNFLTRNGNPGAQIGALNIQTAASTAPSFFEFNTIAANQSLGLLEGGAIVRCSSQVITASHNIIYNNLGGPPLVGICGMSFSDIEGGELEDNNIDQQPIYVDASGGDYHLAPGSPGIDQGAESSAIGIDIDGDARPQGARLDIGADEVPPAALQSHPSGAVGR